MLVYFFTQKTAYEMRISDWSSDVSSSDLQRLVELSLENNRDLRIAVLNIEAARAQYGVTRADRFPTVDLGAGGTRQRTPADLSITRQQTVGEIGRASCRERVRQYE